MCRFCSKIERVVIISSDGSDCESNSITLERIRWHEFDRQKIKRKIADILKAADAGTSTEENVFSSDYQEKKKEQKKRKKPRKMPKRCGETLQQ